MFLGESGAEKIKVMIRVYCAMFLYEKAKPRKYKLKIRVYHAPRRKQN